MAKRFVLRIIRGAPKQIYLMRNYYITGTLMVELVPSA